MTTTAHTRSTTGIEPAEPKSDEGLHGFVTGLPIGAMLVGDGGALLAANEPVCALLGIAEENLVGSEIATLDLPMDQERLWPRVEQLLRGTSRVFNVVKPWIRVDGRVAELQWHGFIARVDRRGRARVVVFVDDVTALHTSRRELEAEAERYRDIVEMSPQGVLRTDAESVISYANQRLADLLGYAPEAMVGQPLAAFLSSNTAAGPPPSEPNQHVDCAFRHRDGREVWMLVSVQPLLDGSGEYLGTVAMLADITDRRRVEQERAQLAAIVESSVDAIFAEAPSGEILSWNRAAAGLYGYALEDALGRTAISLVAPDRVAEVRELGARARRGERTEQFESLGLRREGTSFDVSLTVSPVFGPTGDIVAIATIARDITAHRRFQQQLAFSDRMASLGTLASGVAHEINNPLTYVKSNLDWAVEGLARVGELFTDEATSAEAHQQILDVLDVLREARLGADRVRGIVRDLKTFSRTDDDRPSLVSVHRVLESAINMAWSEIRHRARLVKVLGEVPAVLASDGRLAQVFLNLLVNAAHAISEGNVQGNEIRVTTRRSERGDVVIEIRDTGCGISSENVSRLFDPFFTTKPVGVGTGLGLSICHGIVARLQGSIEVESTRGEGSTFRVILPPGEVLARKSSAPPPAPARARRGRVLCVDDEPMVLASVRRILALEHEVVALASAGEALARITAGETFDAIVSDLMMPQMSGVELYDRIAVVRPALARRVIFLSGGAFTPAMREFLERVPNPRLDKPFDAQMLRALVQNLVLGSDEVEASHES